MNNSKRWIEFLKFWNTIFADDYESVGNLVYYIDSKIRELKENKKEK
jgi:hypothetical protein